MALKDVLTPEEHGALAEGIRGLYTEKEGRFQLDVEGREDTRGLKSALDKERQSRSDLEKQMKAWEALGVTQEEISALLKRQKQQEEPKHQEATPPNPANEQLEKMRKEMDELRAWRAETLEREKQLLRETRVKGEFADYPEAQRGKLARLVEGTTDEEISASAKDIREMFPIQVGAVGGPSNPPTKTKLDSAAEEIGKERAKHARPATNPDTFETI